MEESYVENPSTLEPALPGLFDLISGFDRDYGETRVTRREYGDSPSDHFHLETEKPLSPGDRNDIEKFLESRLAGEDRAERRVVLHRDVLSPGEHSRADILLDY
ncbi:MAG: hypothetical protein ABEI07_01010 [Candidatus Nanohaloarchaea archaeon]